MSGVSLYQSGVHPACTITLPSPSSSGLLAYRDPGKAVVTIDQGLDAGGGDAGCVGSAGIRAINCCIAAGSWLNLCAIGRDSGGGTLCSAASAIAPPMIRAVTASPILRNAC